MEAGKYTLESFAESNGLTKQSALNLLSKLRKKGLVKTSGGGRQKRIYTVLERPRKETNGFYDIVNRYSKIKLREKFSHHVHGNYTVEHAIVDGIRIGDARSKEATMYLFNHVNNWKRLFDLAKKRDLVDEVCQLYFRAKDKMKVKRMPKRYCR